MGHAVVLASTNAKVPDLVIVVVLQATVGRRLPTVTQVVKARLERVPRPTSLLMVRAAERRSTGVRVLVSEIAAVQTEIAGRPLIIAVRAVKAALEYAPLCRSAILMTRKANTCAQRRQRKRLRKRAFLTMELVVEARV
jgi:hypothetical protein